MNGERVYLFASALLASSPRLDVKRALYLAELVVELAMRLDRRVVIEVATHEENAEADEAN